MDMFDWLLCFTLKNAHDKYESKLQTGRGAFHARNESQVYCAKTLSIVFIEVLYKYSYQFLLEWVLT